MRSFKFLLPIIILIVLLLVGTFAYHKIEKWRYLDSLYFSVISVTTIGYGDFTPKTDSGKIFTIIFVFSGIGLVLYSFSLISRYIFRKQLREKLIREGRIKSEKGIRKIKLK